MSEFQGVAASDLSTVLVDLNGRYNGAATGFTVVRFTPGEVPADSVFLSEGEMAGGEQVAVQVPPVKGSFELTAEGSVDIESLRAMFAELAAWLNSNEALLVQPDGQTDPVYYDTYRSPIPSMYVGGREREGVLIVDQLLVASYVFEFWHHPYPRTAGLTIVSADSVSNTTGGSNLSAGTNPGSAPSEGRLQLTIEGSDEVVWAVMGVKEGSLEFPSYAVTGAELLFEAWQPVHRQVLEPTDPAAFEGSYRVLVVYTAAEDVFHFQARYGTSVLGPQANAGRLQDGSDAATHDWTDVNVFEPVVLDLGIVRYDAEDPRLVIEIWARSEGGTDVGSFGEVYLIPADETYMELAVPGFLSGSYGLERYDGGDLATTGGPDETDDGAVKLETADTAFIFGVFGDGNPLPVGRHAVEFRGSIRNKDRTREKQGELQVYLNGGVSPNASVALSSRRGQERTRFDEDDRPQVTWDVTDPDDHYLWGVEFTEAGGPGKEIHLDRLRKSYIPWVTDGRSMVVDQGRREAWIADDTGATTAKLHRTATFYIPPGEVTFAFLIGVQSPNRYSGVDRRGTLPVIDATTAAVTIDVTPRRLHP